MMHPLASTDQLAQRFERFRQLREATPVLFDDATQRWHVFRYADALQVLTDTNRFLPAADDNTSVSLFPSKTEIDPSRRQFVRALVRQAAPPQLAVELTPHITSAAQALLDRARGLGRLDVIGDLAGPLATAVFAQLLAIPRKHRRRFTRWMDVLGADQVTTHDALHELVAYLAQLLEVRRRQPRRDLLSRLQAAEVDGNGLHDSEIVAWCCELLIAGQATATHLLGNAVLCLTDHPDVIAHLRHQPPPIYSTVEEVLRYLPPVWNVTRETATDVTLGAQSIRAQAELCIWVASANRDAEHFANPDRFDIERVPNRHLSLSYGSRADLAAALARQMATSTLTMLVNVLPNLTRVPDGTLEVIESSTFFGVKRLPVTFTPSSPS